jgi:hypothetical protein
VHVSQDLAASACQVRASAPQVAGRAHLTKIDRRLREHPAAQQNGDCMGVDRVVFGLAAMESFHVEGMSEDAGETFAPTPVSHPIPRAETCDRHDTIITIRRHDLEAGLGADLDVLRPQDLPSLVEEANRHRPGMEIDPTGCCRLCGVASPEVSSSVSCRFFPGASSPTVVCRGRDLKK